MATSTTTVSGTQNIPEVLEPYFTGSGTAGQAGFIPGLLPTAQSLFSRNYATVYQPLQAAGLMGTGRIAGIADTQAQQALRSGLLGLETPSEFGLAGQYAGTAAAGLGNLLGSSAMMVGAPSLQSYQMGPTAMVAAPNLNQYGMSAIQAQYAPNLTNFQMGPVSSVNAPSLNQYSMGATQAQYTPQAQGAQMSAAQTAFKPDLTTFQMAAPEQFTSAAADRYMSPFMQGVTDVAKRKAVEDAQRTQLSSNLAAGRKGSLGASGQLLAGTERERALGTQLSDIQTRGLESAYQSAQGQFERDRAAQMAAGQQNLAAQLGVQQLGVQTGLQTALANLSNEQQANVQNMASQLQTQGLNAQQALQVALANQQAGLTAGQQNLAASLGVQQLGAQQGLQAQQLNQAAQQEIARQNLAASLQTQGLSAQQAMQIALANQQAGMTAGQQNLSALLQTQQLGAQQGLQAQQLNQAALQEAARQNLAASLGIQQLGATQSLQAQQANQQAALQAQAQRLAAAQGLGSLASTTGQLGVARQATDLDRLKALGAYGDLERAYAQQKLDAQYQDILRQIGYPEEQLAKMANILRGVPLGDTTSSQIATTPPPSFASQLAGMGLSGLSLYNLFGRP